MKDSKRRAERQDEEWTGLSWEVTDLEYFFQAELGVERMAERNEMFKSDMIDLDAFRGGLWDQAWFKGVARDIPTLIPGDVDGHFYRRGHQLVIEYKSPQAPLRGAQSWLYSDMCDKGYTTFLLIEGYRGDVLKRANETFITPPRITRIEVLSPRTEPVTTFWKENERDEATHDYELARKVVERWWDWASNTPFEDFMYRVLGSRASI